MLQVERHPEPSCHPMEPASGGCPGREYGSLSWQRRPAPSTCRIPTGLGNFCRSRHSRAGRPGCAESRCRGRRRIVAQWWVEGNCDRDVQRTSADAVKAAVSEHIGGAALVVFYLVSAPASGGANPAGPRNVPGRHERRDHAGTDRLVRTLALAGEVEALYHVGSMHVLGQRMA